MKFTILLITMITLMALCVNAAIAGDSTATFNMEDSWFAGATVLVTISSVLANIIPKHTFVGKLLQWMALNFRIQRN
jgi:hypothetical protein